MAAETKVQDLGTAALKLPDGQELELPLLKVRYHRDMHRLCHGINFHFPFSFAGCRWQQILGRTEVATNVSH